jgi:hypothetical protein
MTDTEFENLVDKLFDDHAKAVGDHWVNEVALDHYAVRHFARALLAELNAARKEAKP